MSWKKLLYIGIVFCMSFIMHTHAVNDIPYISQVNEVTDTETDHLAADDGRSHDFQLNEDALAPVAGNAISGRNNHQNSSARLTGGKKLQGRYSWSAEVPCKITVTRTGNFIDEAFLCFPSGLHSAIHHLILLRKLRN